MMHIDTEKYLKEVFVRVLKYEQILEKQSELTPVQIRDVVIRRNEHLNLCCEVLTTECNLFIKPVRFMKRDTKKEIAEIYSAIRSLQVAKGELYRKTI